jgi:hypothetical protein
LTRTADGFFFTGKVQCVFVNGDFAAVGGTIRDSTNASIVGQHFVVYFSGQTTTNPDIDPESNPDESLPADFPATCPSQAPSTSNFFPLTGGFIKYK